MNLVKTIMFTVFYFIIIEIKTYLLRSKFDKEIIDNKAKSFITISMALVSTFVL